MRRLLLPALLTAWLAATALLGVSAVYRPVHAAWLAALYALLAAALHSISRLGLAPGRRRRWAGWPAWVAALPATFAVVWQLREQTFVPPSLVVTALLALVLAPLYAEASRRLAPPLPRGRTFAVAAVAGLLFAALFAAAYHGSEVMRWHLLRHNTMLGTPAFYLLEEPVAARQAALFARHGVRPLPEGTEPTEPAAPDGAPEPNVVFVLLDTLRTDALAAWRARGDSEETPPMPRLDAFLGDAYRLTDVWANSSWTRPSMVSYFTGLLPEEHGVLDIGHRVPESLTLLPELLQERGYATVAFVANVAALGEITGFSQGFDHYYELDQTPYARAGQVRRTVEAWLERPGSPRSGLFLYLHYLDPHEPYLAGDAPSRKSPAGYQRAYRNELEYLDAELVPLLETLERQLASPTVFVIASDHGEEFGEHELYGHGQSLYGELIDVPVAVKMPDTSGGDLPARLEARDLFDLLVRIGSGETVSLEDWARERERERRYASVYYSREGRLALRPYLRRVAMRAVEEDGRKLIWSAYGDTRELYHLTADAAERQNLLGQPETGAGELTAGLDRPVGRWVAPQAFEPTAENLEQLRALGYVD